jgi:hypothetical protein
MTARDAQPEASHHVALHSKSGGVLLLPARQTHKNEYGEAEEEERERDREQRQRESVCVYVRGHARKCVKRGSG